MINVFLNGESSDFIIIMRVAFLPGPLLFGSILSSCFWLIFDCTVRLSPEVSSFYLFSNHVSRSFLDRHSFHSYDALWDEIKRIENWAIRSSARSFARTTHSFSRSALLALLARSAALIRSLAHSLAPELMGKRFMSLK